MSIVKVVGAALLFSFVQLAVLVIYLNTPGF